VISENSEPYPVRIIRADMCPDIDNCEHVGTTPVRPGRVQLIAKTVTDPQLIAAYADKIGPGEILVEMGVPMLHQLNLEAS
jgi:hypothetical protein